MFDPNWATPDGRKPTLLGLGAALERLESAARKGTGKERTGPPRWNDGSCDNEDPWFDGRGHDYTIVDSPRSGTYLSRKDVYDLVSGGAFWHVPIGRATVFVLRPVDAEGGGLGNPAPGFTCRRIDPCSLEGPLPDGFELLELTSVGSSATLETLVAWTEDADRKARGALWILADLKLDATSLADGQVQSALESLGRGQLRPGPRGSVVMFNRRALAVRDQASEENRRIERVEKLREALVTAVRRSQLLKTFGEDLSRLFQGGKIVGGRALQGRFSRFVSTELCADRIQDDEVLEVFQGISDELRIGERYQLIANELDRIAALEQQDAEKVTNGVLFFIGLGGLVEAAFAGSWNSGDGIRWSIVLTLALVASLVFFRAASSRRTRNRPAARLLDAGDAGAPFGPPH